MELKYTVAARIARPVAEVFEAVVDPAKLSNYFTTGGATGRMETGTTVMWKFHDFPGEHPVEIIEVVPDEKIILEWEAHEGEGEDGGSAGYMIRAVMEFSVIDGGKRTLIRISEHGWKETPSGLKASYGNCEGWMQMMCSLKAWLEHGINLREGFYK